MVKQMRFGLLVIGLATLLLFGSVSFTAQSQGVLSLDMRWCLSAIVLAVESLLMVWSLYQVAIAIAGFWSPKPPAAQLKRQPRILCLTAAHNEEKVIAEHIRNLQAMAYPSNRYDIVILADNCTDQTARIARKLGAHVWERHNPSQRGKGFALYWALHTKANLKKYDAVCIFDADNLVDPNFLSVMASHIQNGHVAIQGYLDTKNPWDSWVTTSYASAYWFMNRFWQRARIVLGLSAALGGTGFCLSTAVLRQVPWEAMSLTEDLEYTIRLILRGYKVHWTSQAHVYDEKPVRYQASVPQRKRWMQGHWSTALRYSKPLLHSFLFRKKGRMRALDMLIYVWQPAFVLLMGANLLLSAAQWFFGTTWFYPWLITYVPAPVWGVLGAIGFSLPLLAFVLERSNWRAFAYFPMYLLFNVSWIPVTVEALRHIHNTEWVHTEHNRAINLEEIRRVRNHP